ncbi:MAG: 3-dehydroquinate synthase [Pyrobaculum sp.]
MKLFYRHSRGVTEVVVGRGLDYKNYGRDVVVVVEEGLNSPLPDAPTLVLKGGEEVKDLSTLTKIYQFFREAGVDRSSTIYAVGGGALLDVVTFAAGTYMRGVGLVNVPTTLLAMVDAALGGKGAVDWGPVKNLVGVVYQPKAILCDLKWLDTLPSRVYRSAFAEVVKYGVSLDEEFFHWLEANVEKALGREDSTLSYVIYRSLQKKAEVVELDEFEERGIRQVLNVGHTIGHAVERVFGLLHGEAVSVGMVAELRLSQKMGYLKEETVERVTKLLESFELPTYIDVNQIEKAASLIKYDKKKRGDYIYMPLVVRLGKWVLEKVKIEDVVEALGYVVRRGR